MIFTETRLKGAYIIEPERLEDERGFFARVCCEKEFRQHGINRKFVQCNISFNRKAGTMRGMHYQAEPHAEAKLVRCTAGSIHDVIIDLRHDSKTFREWTSVKLDSENRTMIYIPEGFAHGFITLEDETEVFYQMSEFFAPECAKGIRWNDPVFDIKWPVEVKVISEKDRSYPDLKL